MPVVFGGRDGCLSQGLLGADIILSSLSISGLSRAPRGGRGGERDLGPANEIRLRAVCRVFGGIMALYLLLLAGAAAAIPGSCPHYVDYASSSHEPLSSGKYQLAYQRPQPECRTTSYAEVEKTIDEMKVVVKDPDLYRLFENSFPNTLDTTVSWKGVAADNSKEEVSFSFLIQPSCKNTSPSGRVSNIANRTHS